uniref:hypothetical protein n=1 Tax=Psammodictyon constrictum TaxID=515483 RepID=UPI001EFA0353|nr:hypothetical protein MKU01_pgp036 [Psammodictyon constrictum]ULD16457.1 hypothetical protein [Psammodictyon constrictum]
MSNQKNQNRKKRFLNHLGKVSVAIITASLMTSPALAVDPAEVASQAIGSEGGRKAAKEAIAAAMNAAKTRPAMGTATLIVCLACAPAAGAAASPGLCVACGILIAKTFG